MSRIGLGMCCALIAVAGVAGCPQPPEPPADTGNDGVALDSASCQAGRTAIDGECYLTCSDASDCVRSDARCESISGSPTVCVVEDSDTGAGDVGERDTDAGPDVIEGMGTESCSKVYECVLDCEDDSCRRNCKRNGTKDATEQFRKIENCRAANCSDADDPRQCMLENCGQHYERCGLTGTDECDRSLACALTCSGDNCARSCVLQGSLRAQRRYGELLNCFSNRCSGTKNTGDILSCMARKCDQKMTTCGATGQKNCKDAVICRQTCNANLATCRLQCGFEATPRAQEDIYDLLSCRINNCNSGNRLEDRKCMYNFCLSGLEDCGLVGNQNCKQIFNCIVDCPSGDSDCARNCSVQGDADAQQKLFELEKCVQKNNCSTADCPACSGERDTCANDS